MEDMRFPRNMFIQDYAKEYDFPDLFDPITVNFYFQINFLSICLGLKIMKFDFFTLIDSLFAKNQLDN